MILSPHSLAIAGTGRLAQALGRRLGDRSQPVVVIAGRNPERMARAARFISSRTTAVAIQEIPDLASHLLIAVSDSAVECVASLLARSGFQRGVALHTCGAKGPEALAVLARQGICWGALHPIQSFASPEQGLAAMPGSNFAIDGDPEALEWCSFVCDAVRWPQSPDSRKRSRFVPRAAVMASSYIAALMYGALEMLHAAGIERSIALSTLAPLAKTCTENALHFGPIDALTGPIERGDT